MIKRMLIMLLLVGCGFTAPAEDEEEFSLVLPSGFWANGQARWDPILGTDSAYVAVSFSIGYKGELDSMTVTFDSMLFTWDNGKMGDELETMSTAIPPPGGYWETNEAVWSTQQISEKSYDTRAAIYVVLFRLRAGDVVRSVTLALPVSDL